MRRLARVCRRTLMEAYDWVQLPARTKREVRRDRAGVLGEDPGPQRVIDASLQWIARAQDSSLTADGGVARHFSWSDGWGASYPETTGYIVSTVIDQSQRLQRDDLRQRAIRMLDWLVSIQFPEGGFQGGVIGETPRVPVTFNTGQILLGLAAGTAAFGDPYREPMLRAAEWLVATIDPDGCWRKFPTPFAGPGEKAYETHVSWGILEAARAAQDSRFAETALHNMRWAVAQQRQNGWFEKCCLVSPDIPLTHTIGYVLRGLVEGYSYSKEQWLLDASVRTADALLSCQAEDGSIAGRLNSDWQPAVDYVCLTGVAQISACWLLLFDSTGKPEYLHAARKANRYVRRTIRVEGDPDLVGGVKGSFPIDGAYGKYQMLNWAAKFVIDANQLEIDRAE